MKASCTSSPPMDSSTFFPPSHEDRCGSPWIESRGRLWWILKLILLESPMTSLASNTTWFSSSRPHRSAIWNPFSSFCLSAILVPWIALFPALIPPDLLAGPWSLIFFHSSSAGLSYSALFSLYPPSGLTHLSPSVFSLHGNISSLNFVLNPSYLLLVISSEHLPFTQSQQVQNGVQPLFPPAPPLLFLCLVCCSLRACTCYVHAVLLLQLCTTLCPCGP